MRMHGTETYSMRMGLELGFRLHTKDSVHGLIELLKIEVDELLRL